MRADWGGIAECNRNSNTFSHTLGEKEDLVLPQSGENLRKSEMTWKFENMLRKHIRIYEKSRVKVEQERDLVI